MARRFPSIMIRTMKIGIIGSGMIGATVGKLWADAGHEVFFSSRHPEQLKPLVQSIGARAHAGTVAEAAREATKHASGSAGWAAEKFPDTRWVKAFNSVYFKTLETEAHRKGDRVGIPLASDDEGALEVAAQLVRDAGFDPVIAGPLARGKAFEPGTKVYNTGISGAELRKVL